MVAAEYLLNNKCNFIDRPVALFLTSFGEPDVHFEWKSHRRTEDRVFTYRYKLFTAKYGDKYTFGDKWLHITTNAERVIKKILIHTVDE